MNADITIIIPTYNLASLIKETIDSVLVQNNPNWQCIIIDDGSTDGTFDSVTAFAKADARIQAFKRTTAYKAGGNGARQMGLDLTTTPFVMFLDSDDFIAAHCVGARLQSITQKADMHVYHTGTFLEHLGDQDILWNTLNKNDSAAHNLKRFLMQDMPWHTAGVLWNRTFLQEIGGWNQELTAWQDWELHVRALTHNPLLNIHTTPPDSFYRQNVTNSIATKKQTPVYLTAVYNAIVAVEPLVLNYTSSSEIKKQLRFLMYRNFIVNPLKWRQREISKQWAETISFKTVSKSRFKRMVLLISILERVSVKRILKHKLKLSVYQYLRPNTTFLKTTYPQNSQL